VSAALYLGLMSGTSVDGIDAVLAAFEGQRFCGLRGQIHRDYPPPLRAALLALSRNQRAVALEELCALDAAVAEEFSAAAQAVLSASGTQPGAVVAIGSHGQTVFHEASRTSPLTLQLGDPSRIAARTGITTVADFRRKDTALGGQGAPLVPAFHHALFAQASERRGVLNLGGIANLTWLPAAQAAAVRGFDTGPGNALLDEWAQRQLGRGYDAGGAFAQSGRVNPELLSTLLAEPFFARSPPKSTGRGAFNLAWAASRYPGLYELPPADVQATFAELTAASIAAAIAAHAPGLQRLLLCGGGTRNADLLARLEARLPGVQVQTTAAYGLDPLWVEATAFAWLAMRTLAGLPGNLPAVTGADRAAVLGGIFPA
jgi:anhydro-N-acetylmuramic acid kinase